MTVFVRRSMLILAALIALVGCGVSQAEQLAMLEAFHYDMRISMQTSLMEGSDQEREQRYVELLADVPLDDCPEDFQQAFRAHIAAWQAGDDAEIDRTWDEAVRISETYGLRHNVE